MNATTRVRRNFWVLVAAAVVAAGLLSLAVQMPPSPLAGVLTALSGLGALAALTLAGRIIVVTGASGVGRDHGTGQRRTRPRRASRHPHR